MTTYKSFSDALNIPHIDIEEDLVEGIDYINLEQVIIPGLGFDGMKHTEEAKEKIRQSKLGKPRPKEVIEALKARRNPMQGRKHSKETLAKMSESQRGENHPLYGKKHSEETRKKISEALKRRRGK